MALTPLLKDYDARNIRITWNGIPIQAYKDVFLEVVFDTDMFSIKKGMDGNVCYTALTPSMVTLKFNTHIYSPSNAFLWDVVKSQMESGAPQIASLTITDDIDGEILTGINAVLTTPSNFTMGKTHEESSNTWIFKATEPKLPNFKELTTPNKFGTLLDGILF